MKDITFLGAAGEVTGSSFLLHCNEDYLIDLGMFQGSEDLDKLNYDELKIDINKLKAVFVTHAHLDHIGRLPLLAQIGYRGKIYCTKATKELTELSLYDSAKINKINNDLPLYSNEDVDQVLSLIEVIEYHTEYDLGEIKYKYIDAGHILGSASILITHKDGHKIAFSGDIGNYPEAIVKPTEFFDYADYVLLESTYGDKAHPHEESLTILQKEINSIEQSGSFLLIPAFSLDRTQTIMHMIKHLKQENKVMKDTVVYLDSPMAISATKIYANHPDLFNSHMRMDLKDGAPFSFQGLKIIDSAKQSKKIKRTKGPTVIIAGSGMMTGGRILNHGIDLLPNPKNRLLIVGYQAEGTVGRQILEGERDLEMYGENVHMNASLQEISALSAHADQPRLLEWLGKINGVKKVFLVHGEEHQRDVLAQKINEKYNLKTEKPAYKETLQI